MNKMQVDEENDEVVQEFDVFLSKELIENLHVLQYPITHAKQTYYAGQRLNAKVKPIHKKLEIEVLLDVNSANYDQSKGEQIALNVDGGVQGDTMTYENSVMDTQVLTSRCVPSLGKRFAAAIIQYGQVHITPVAQIMQLQPSFKYMDRAETRAAQVAKMKAQAESGNSSQDEADDAKAVTVRFKGAETEAARAARERSYTAYEKRLFQEKWISASVHHKDDAYAQRERNRLLCNAEPSSDISVDNSLNFTEMSLSFSDYLKTLIPHYIVSDIDSDVTPDNVLSLAKLKAFSLGDQLKMLMKNAKIMHFSHLVTLLPSVLDIQSTVRLLQLYAVLIKGCWIVKSEVLYPPNTVSALTGTPAEVMCKVRDFILCLFTKHEYLVRKDVAKQVKISSDEVKIIFEEISKMKVGLGWHLKLSPDTRFNSEFAEVYQRQTMLWAARFKQLAKQFNYDFDANDSNISTNAAIKHNMTNAKSGNSKHTKSKVNAKKSVSKKNHPSQSVHDSGPVTATNGVADQISSIETFVASTQVKSEPDMNFLNDIVPMQVVEPMDVESNVESNNMSNTSNLFMSNTENVDLSNITVLSSSTPFVIPQTVGVEASFENLTDGFAVSNVSLPGDKSSSINMDSINSTVALVTDQLRQCNDVLFSNNDEPMIENEVIFHNDISNNCEPSH